MRRFRLRRLALAAILAVAAALVLAATAAADDGQLTTNSQKWAFIVGFFLPLAIAAIKRRGWPMWLQSCFAFGCVLLAAVGTAYWQSTLSWENWTSAALSILVATIVSYMGVWKPTGVADKIDKATG